ncbi:MAG: bifunctional 2-polyprenyl-6-hydroxyphenol methylase/3-demethylubiquinol 3-O-methyltransferase UbiG [Legionellaceae bacterium]|nr:bifunctional 2-polyprenyl-6-hydroxyphenol methylase/3-demethylubiquinol 3-O-methyltransferase UbiG [Legionellaceae bacterium]
MTIKSTIDPSEVAKFAQHATVWWEREGPLKTLHDINPIRIEFIQKIVALNGQRILDIGCGGGILSEGMTRCGAMVTGLDVEVEAIETARAHALQSQLTIDYVCKPIELFDAKPFPIITCLEMLEHVTDPEIVINHAARLLEPGGYLILSTINRTVKAYATVVLAAEYLLGILPRQTHDFQKFIKPSELMNMARGAGLEFVDMSGISYNPFTRDASLAQSVAGNYLLVCRAPNRSS